MKIIFKRRNFYGNFIIKLKTNYNSSFTVFVSIQTEFLLRLIFTGDVTLYLSLKVIFMFKKL